MAVSGQWENSTGNSLDHTGQKVFPTPCDQKSSFCSDLVCSRKLSSVNRKLMSSLTLKTKRLHNSVSPLPLTMPE